MRFFPGFLLVQAEPEHPIAPPCFHGVKRHADDLCDCDPGWRLSGPTDAVQFLLGRCDQFMCESTAQCQALLPEVQNPSCPILGWNCYCGAQWSLAGTLTGHENADAKCMGLLYVFSIQGSEALEWLFTWVWKVFALLSFLCLPLGQCRAGA